MAIQWLRRAVQCCGKPVFFYSGIYTTLGLLFVLGSFYLDPDMGTIGLILLFVGASILVLYFTLAYKRLRRSGDR